MQISEVVKETGLTKKAVDYYVRRKLICPTVLANGYRDFGSFELERLHRIKILRSLGLSVGEIQEVFDSEFPREELRKIALKKKVEQKTSQEEIHLLQEFADKGNSKEIQEQLKSLNQKKTLKIKLLEALPDFYGRYFVLHFGRFLEGSIETKIQEEAYEKIVSFLDQVEVLKLPEDMMMALEEAMDFWTDQRLEAFHQEQEKYMNHFDDFLQEHSTEIESYLKLKESQEYMDSIYGQIMKKMQEIWEKREYQEQFIPAMRELSPDYEKYYKKLLEANQKWMTKYPEVKKGKKE